MDQPAIVQSLESDEQPRFSYPVAIESLRNKTEYGVIVRCTEADDNKDDLVDLDKLRADVQDYHPAERLGLELSKWDLTYRLSHFVGAVWLQKPAGKEPGIVLAVQPKIADLNAVRMFVEVATSPDYSHEASSDRLFDCEPSQPAMEGVTLPDMTLLQVAVYLRALSQFCQRNLRQDFARTRENLIGRVKGRILISANIRQNTVRGRSDRVVCEFTRMTLDTPANRILKVALVCCAHYLSIGPTLPPLLDWLRQCDAALAEVSDATITDADFRGMVYSGLMQRYRRVHGLARMILKRLSTDANGQIPKQPSQTVPFYLNMWRLFELYVGVQLAKTGKRFKPQSQYSLPFTIDGKEVGSIGFRPDYCLPEDEGVIVDAKYKSIIDSAMPEEGSLISLSGLQFANGVQPGNADVYQVIAYCDLFTVINPKSTFKIAVLMAPGAPQCEIPDRFDWNEFIGRGATLDLGTRRIIVLPCPVPKRQAVPSDNY